MAPRPLPTRYPPAPDTPPARLRGHHQARILPTDPAIGAARADSGAATSPGHQHSACDRSHQRRYTLHEPMIPRVPGRAARRWHLIPRPRSSAWLILARPSAPITSARRNTGTATISSATGARSAAPGMYHPIRSPRPRPPAPGATPTSEIPSCGSATHQPGHASEGWAGRPSIVPAHPRGHQRPLDALARTSGPPISPAPAMPSQAPTSEGTRAPDLLLPPARRRA